jgi:hypothetical protein
MLICKLHLIAQRASLPHIDPPVAQITQPVVIVAEAADDVTQMDPLVDSGPGEFLLPSLRATGSLGATAALSSRALPAPAS